MWILSSKARKMSHSFNSSPVSYIVLLCHSKINPYLLTTVLCVCYIHVTYFACGVKLLKRFWKPNGSLYMNFSNDMNWSRRKHILVMKRIWFRDERVSSCCKRKFLWNMLLCSLLCHQDNQFLCCLSLFMFAPMACPTFLVSGHTENLVIISSLEPLESLLSLFLKRFSHSLHGWNLFSY